MYTQACTETRFSTGNKGTIMIRMTLGFCTLVLLAGCSNITATKQDNRITTLTATAKVMPYSFAATVTKANEAVASICGAGEQVTEYKEEEITEIIEKIIEKKFDEKFDERFDKRIKEISEQAMKNFTQGAGLAPSSSSATSHSQYDIVLEDIVGLSAFLESLIKWVPAHSYTLNDVGCPVK